MAEYLATWTWAEAGGGANVELVVATGWSLPPRLRQLPHVRVQPVEAPAPEPLEAAHPRADRPQPAGVQLVQPLLARPADPHEPDLPEDPQVLGRLRLGHPQVPRQAGHRPLAAPQQPQDLPPPRFGDRVERVRGRRRSCRRAIICPYRNVSTPVARPHHRRGLCDERRAGTVGQVDDRCTVRRPSCASSRTERRYLNPTGLSPTSCPATPRRSAAARTSGTGPDPGTPQRAPRPGGSWRARA